MPTPDPHADNRPAGDPHQWQGPEAAPCDWCLCCSARLCQTAQQDPSLPLQDCAYHCDQRDYVLVKYCPCSRVSARRARIMGVTNLTPPAPTLSGP